MNVLVLGVPRSGTSWVGRMLAGTPACDYIHEPDNEKNRLEALYGKTGLDRFPMLDRSGQAIRYHRLWKWAFGRRPLSGRINKGVYRRTRAPYAAIGGQAPSVAQAAGRFLISASLPRNTKHRVVKSVHAPLAVNWLAAHHLADHVIIMRRDPLNVIASWIELDLPDRDRHLDASGTQAPPPEREDPLTRVAWQYGVLQSALERALEDNPTWVGISHESLVRDPATFRGLAIGAGLNWSDEDDQRVSMTDAQGRGYEITRSRDTLNERWKQVLSQSDAERIRAVVSRFDI